MSAREASAARQVTLWAEKAREATARRDAAIVAMRASGAPLRVIAAAAGITHTAVAKILAKQAQTEGEERA